MIERQTNSIKKIKKMKYAIKTRSEIKTDKGNHFEVLFTEKLFNTETEAKQFVEKMKAENLALADTEEEISRVSAPYQFTKIIPVQEKNNGHEIGYEIELDNSMNAWIQKETETFGSAREGFYIPTDKVPYCGEINIWGEINDKGEITNWSGDTGGEFERDFTAEWTPRGYRINWVTILK